MAGPSITSLGTYDGVLGDSLLVDPFGRIYGTATQVDGGNGSTVFSFSAGAFATLGSFDYGTTGGSPTDGLAEDSLGNLYATTFYGGTGGNGFVDTVSATNPLTALATTPLSPEGPPVVDAAGDVFYASSGTTIYELKAGSHEVTTFASVATNGELTIDAEGNIYGTNGSGAHGYGSVFEITPDGTVSTLVSFDATNGDLPEGKLIIDAAGNLYGNAHNLFEIAAGSHAYSVLANFTDDGVSEVNQIAVDADGAIYGTTTASAAAPDGTVYKLAAGSDTVTTLLDDADNVGGLAVEANGDLVGTSGDEIFEVTPCYRRGTRILTERGEVAVESLRIGDQAITASGGTREVRWIGHRRLDLIRHSDPISVWPVCVQRNALGEGMPSRDLWLSPGHNLAIGGVLMAAGALQNGVTIRQVQCPAVEYWHVELDQHDILFAEGTPAESYLDTGNRTGFVNGGAFIEAYPDFRPRHWAETCLPLVFEGPEMDRARIALLARAQVLGYVVTSESDMHLIADGRRIDPTRISSTRFVFNLPADRADISLRSRCFVPAHTCAPSTDRRLLGVCVKTLWIDEAEIALDDEASFAEGWHSLERGLGYPEQRWTRGVAPMPPNSRSIVIDLAGRGHYWNEPNAEILADRVG